MNNGALFRRIAAISAIIAALLILAATFVLTLAVDFDFDFLANPADLITAGLDAEAAGLFRWGSILELLGSFLFLIPPALYLWQWLRPQNPGLVNMATVFGLVLRFERPVLGVATTIMGATILGAGVGWLFRVDPLARLELFYFFEPFWAIWLGIVIWRGAEKGEQIAAAAAAV